MTEDELDRVTRGPAYPHGKTVAERISDLTVAAAVWKAKALKAGKSLGADNAITYADLAADCLRRAENLRRNFRTI